MKIAKIQSSGKEGAEKAALMAANKIGISITGWKPKKSEVKRKELKETPSTKEEQSIIWNVRDSHATLIIEPMDVSSAASLAYEVAESFGRPYIISDDAEDIIHWLNTLDEEITLNVTGPSENESKGITKKTREILAEVFATFDSFLLEV